MSNATEEMGQILRVCYCDSMYNELMCQVEDNLRVNQQLRAQSSEKSSKLKTEVVTVQKWRKQLQLFAKQREEARIYYDHYRHKVQVLETQARKTNTMGNEKLTRNQGKFG